MPAAPTGRRSEPTGLRSDPTGPDKPADPRTDQPTSRKVIGVHAVTLPAFGPPEVMIWAPVTDPIARSGEVVIDVVAAGVNRADLLQREGHYPAPPGASIVPGLECSGRIREIGPGVDNWRIGDEVCALLGGGGYAERVAVPAGHVLPAPVGVPLAHAAGLPEAACTVWSTVFTVGRARAGETLLVHGGTSGIGTFAIQLAHALGVRVIATAGTPTKCARAITLGADLAISYKDEDFVAAVRAATDGRGADVILDMVGGNYLARNLDALALDGRLIVLATQGGRRAELDLAALMSKRGTIYAGGLRARPPEQKTEIVAQVRAQVWPLVEAGAIKVVVEAEVPIERAAQAHRILEAGNHIGKVLLIVG
jgi:putative PIG3 family NAD(P)H quinone oxidoreductase